MILLQITPEFDQLWIHTFEFLSHYSWFTHQKRPQKSWSIPNQASWCRLADVVFGWDPNFIARVSMRQHRADNYACIHLIHLSRKSAIWHNIVFLLKCENSLEWNSSQKNRPTEVQRLRPQIHKLTAVGRLTEEADVEAWAGGLHILSKGKWVECLDRVDTTY